MSRRFVVLGIVCGIVLACLSLCGSALAAGPEAPEVRVEDTTAAVTTPSVEARLHGVLNPKGPGEEGTYQFQYKASTTGECEGGEVAPASPGMAFGFGDEEYYETIVGLSPDTTYAACLRAENDAKASARSAVVTFTTPPEAPEELPPESVTTTTATLNGALAPNATSSGEAGSYEFRYRQSASECEGGESSEDKTAPVPAGAAAGHAKEAESAAVTGLQHGTQYTFCLLERNDAGETAIGAPTTFTTRGAGITGEQASTVEASAATLQASIDPNESETSYRFEYDTTPYTSSAPHGTSVTDAGEGEEVELGSETTPVPVSVRLKGLQPDTTYYYRVVATDTIEAFDGPGKSFTTPPAPGSEPGQACPNEQLRSEQPYGLTLPDCRAYELVSPAETNGGNAIATEYLSRASVSGEAITFSTTGAAYGDPSGAEFVNQLLSVREPANERWSTRSISPPYFAGGAGELGPYEAVAFTPDLSRGVATTDVPLTDEVPAEGLFNLYLAELANGSFQWASNAPNAGDPYQYNALYRPLVMGTSTDLSHVVFKSAALYEWANGTVRPVGVNNKREQISAGAGTGNGYYEKATDTYHAVSADGSRVFFTSPNSVLEASRVLYVRENAEQEQSPVDGKGECTEPTQACTVEVAAGARYWGANAEGTEVFYTREGDLYEYRLPAAQTAGQATALTKGGAVQGVVQISEDGAYVYFVAKGALKGEHGEVLRNASGVEPVPGEDNLYVSHEGGAPTFIATLAEGDTSDWRNGEYEVYYQASPITNTAVLTPGGTRLAFISSRSLTGYDNEQAQPGDCEHELAENERHETGACREIYTYDAATEQLVCASCNPSGARPIGPASFEMNEGGEQYRQYKPRNLAEDGTLFFQSYDALVPGDDNHRRDVYEYDNGHLDALSDVSGDGESALIDASPSGDDVFIATADHLLPRAEGDRNAVYDVRIGGGFPASASAPQCDSGDTCKPPPTPQPGAFATPASATFSGPGSVTPASPAPVATKPKSLTRTQKLAQSLRACKGKPRKQRRSCEKQARKRYGAPKAKHATNKRRAH